MLNSLTSSTSATGHAYRAQALRSQETQDSQGSINVLPAAPAQPLIGRIELLPDATELQLALMETVNEARTSIKADFHLLKGTQGQELARQLARRARQGLRVQLIAWGAATPAFTEAVRAARALGLNVRIGRSSGTPNRNAVAKYLVADDRVALVGNPGQGGKARRGLLRVTGAPACEMARQFNHDWSDAGGTPLPLATFGELARQGKQALLSAVVVGGQGAERQNARALVLAALQRARISIEVMGDQIDDQAVVAALISAHGRGVKVKVLLGAADATPDAAASTVSTLLRAGVPVRRCQAGGQEIAVEMRYGVVDGESVLFGTQPWTRSGFAANGEVLLEARGGREVALIRATFLHDWTDANIAVPPTPGSRLRSAIRPVLSALTEVARRYSPAMAVRHVWDLHVGLVRFPGGRWKLIADAR
jgi:phosphatidylserine/phosphatidylglycerophosphate/cardiolipin synthase-like enzyme